MRGLSLVVASGGHSSSRYAGLSLSRPLLLRSTGSRRAGSVVVAHGPSGSAACGIFPDQGSNPCPLHWQADSQPLRHQGSPECATVWSLFCCCWGHGCAPLQHSVQFNTQNKHFWGLVKAQPWNRQVPHIANTKPQCVDHPRAFALAVSSTLKLPQPLPCLRSPSTFLREAFLGLWLGLLSFKCSPVWIGLCDSLVNVHILHELKLQGS